MDVSARHFEASDERHIHLFSEHPDLQQVTARVSEIAQTLDFHLVIIDGADISDDTSLVWALAQHYQFPSEYQYAPYQPANWDSVNDLMGDLTWLTGWPVNKDKVKGFLLLYLHPSVLFSSNPVQFATFLSIISDAAQEHQKQNLPFHLLLGPVNHEVISFTRMLRVINDICNDFDLFVS